MLVFLILFVVGSSDSETIKKNMHISHIVDEKWNILFDS